MRRRYSTAPVAAAICAAVTLVAGTIGAAGQAPAAGQGPAARGGGGGRGGVAPALFTAVDADKDGSVTHAEMKAAFEKWYADSDASRSGSITQDQLSTALSSALPPPPPPPPQAAGPECGGRSANPRTACPQDVAAMMAVMPDKAPAKPQKPRKILVLAVSRGFVHSSIPLAAMMVEEMGKKTGAWTATTSWDAADINTENLKQYDLIFLDSTTGFFLDDPNDAAATEARRKALLEFVRSGKGLVGIHAASDSYHGNPAGRGGAAGGGGAPGAGAGRAGRGGGRGGGGTGATLALMMMTQADKNSDQKVTREEISALADSWYEKLDSTKAGKVSQADFSQRFAGLTPQAPAGGRGQGGPAPVNAGLWPEFNKMIGGWFKFHWNDPQLIVVKIDDPKSPINAPFKGQSFEIRDETYTFPMDSWSRDNVHVLTSVDYSKMSEADKAAEGGGRRTDGDYGLCWIRREGKGRVFYEAHGHSERVYAMKPMLEHILAGIQYALGDLKADDTPSAKGGTK